jgi:uncharacterized protein YndB with AHSA1/START domain
MPLSPIVHGNFSVTRRYKHATAKVFAAYADPSVKRRWFAEGEGFIVDSYELDFRVGGRESCKFRPEGGPPMTMDAVYHEIAENRRIVIAYDMTLAGEILSLSISSTEIEADGAGAKLTYTEHGIYYGDAAAVAGREEGTRQLLEALSGELGA